MNSPARPSFQPLHSLAHGVDHAENFPVASWLCPPALRPAVKAIYHFARQADDMADEGEAPAPERLASLAKYRLALVAMHERDAVSNALPAAWQTIFSNLLLAKRRHALPLQPLLDLLTAFERDCSNPLHEDRDSLLDYCRHSANPVGRLMLHLHGKTDARSLQQSDAMCTALQLINFWQDISRDHPRGRVYVPRADALRHGLNLQDLPKRNTPETRRLVAELVAWARTTMLQGAPLARRMPGRVGFELRLVVQGGLRILDKIERTDHASFEHRVSLQAWDALPMVWQALWMPSDAGRTAQAMGRVE